MIWNLTLQRVVKMSHAGSLGAEPLGIPVCLSHTSFGRLIQRAIPRALAPSPDTSIQKLPQALDRVAANPRLSLNHPYPR